MQRVLLFSALRSACGKRVSESKRFGRGETRVGRGYSARGLVAFLSGGQALQRRLLPEVCPLPGPWLAKVGPVENSGWT